MNDELLTTLLQKLDKPAARYADLERYYSGTQPLAYLSPEAKDALGSRFGRMASNLPRLAVTSLAERLRVTGFTGVDVWEDWLRNDMDQESAVAHREALLLGSSYVIVWADQTGATTTGFHVVDTIANPLGVPPVVRLLNSDRIVDEGVSEIEDLKPLVDGLNKIAPRRRNTLQLEPSGDTNTQ